MSNDDRPNSEDRSEAHLSASSSTAGGHPQTALADIKGDAPAGAPRNLFVSHLPVNIDDTALRELFTPFGRILSARVMLHIRCGNSRGYGFVLFENSDDAVAAQREMNEKVLPTQSTDSDTSITPADGEESPQQAQVTIHVSFSEHTGDNLLIESPKLYVRNVPNALTLSVQDLLAYFLQFGEVISLQARGDRFQGHAFSDVKVSESRYLDPACFVPPGPNGIHSIRVLFIEFDSAAAARACADATHHTSPFPTCRAPPAGEGVRTAGDP